MQLQLRSQRSYLQLSRSRGYDGGRVAEDMGCCEQVANGIIKTVGCHRCFTSDPAAVRFPFSMALPHPNSTFFFVRHPSQMLENRRVSTQSVCK